MSTPISATTSAQISLEQESDIAQHTTTTLSKTGWRFWVIFPTLMLVSLLVAVESTVTSTALPFIVHELNAGELYVWFVNAYFLTSAAFLPLFGQLADIFGRRWVFISVVAIFTLGSGIAGGSNTATMLIAGRAVQGIGGGGINLCIELVVSDLVPLRERGNYMALLFAFFALGTAMGPFVGGVLVERSSWRWVFWLNLPLGGVALISLLIFLRVKYDRTTAMSERLKRIDYIGTLILVGAVTSVLIGLSYGGTLYAWSDARIIVPLVLGILGLFVFHAYETASWVKYPTLPEQVFRRRTPAAALLLAFLSFMLLFWAIYFLPVYFQAVLLAGSTQSGVWLLPTVLVEVPLAVVGGALVTKTGRYKPLHLFAFGVMTLGFGLFARFDRWTSTAEWVIVQMLPAFGVGFMMSTNLPAVQADLPEEQVAAATAAFSFMRAYGSIWGVAIPAAVFNARFAVEAYRITDEAVRDRLSDGEAYSYVTAALIGTFTPETRDQVVDVFTRALKVTWLASIAPAALGFALVFMEKEVVLRTELDTKFGLEDGQKGGSGGAGSSDVESDAAAGPVQVKEKTTSSA
ncbi:major facilitator superfamily domain-containing protein [Microdochium trichocladiopsis]|uniref:Major facilitator superfamily domain-containing protein n=1 Tax=Microdochium trichocladiopsis TaxID=1682393 RepID=A0A9P8XY25_9PEZI|nr:major facilitator superfamily domain-containing protein [Microdochium trichocladiopsis]KAH7024902.1 major facilitator superfamily domain-containing protein [Microdochium trichocladiopsis]